MHPALNAPATDGEPVAYAAIDMISRTFGRRQSHWPAKHGGVFNVARNVVTTVPFIVYGGLVSPHV